MNTDTVPLALTEENIQQNKPGEQSSKIDEIQVISPLQFFRSLGITE